MKRKLKKGDLVKMLPAPELFKVLKDRNFCTNDATRKYVADTIGGKKGVVSCIEDRYAYDYFFFLPSEDRDEYSVPYQAVDTRIEGRPVLLTDLIDTIHYTIIKHRGKNDIALNEINSLDALIRVDKKLENYSVEETERWQEIMALRDGSKIVLPPST